MIPYDFLEENHLSGHTSIILRRYGDGRLTGMYKPNAADVPPNRGMEEKLATGLATRGTASAERLCLAHLSQTEVANIRMSGLCTFRWMGTRLND